MKLLLLSLCLMLLPASTVASGEELLPVRLCLNNSMGTASAFVADKQGFFRAEGLDAKIEKTNNAQFCQADALAGRTDIAFASDSVFTTAAISNPNLAVLAQVHISSDISVTVRSDAKIETWDDLKGKKIGYLPGTGSSMYMYRLLKKLGWSKDDVRLVTLQPPAMVQALSGGMIDAFVVWEPWGSLALEQLGERGKKLTRNDIFNYYRFVMLARQDVITEKPETVRRVLRALLRAEDYMRTHAAESRTIIGDATGYSQKTMMQNWDLYDNTLRLDEDLIKHLEDDASIFISTGPNFADKAVPDFRRFIEPKFLREVAPERVTLP